MSHWESLPLFAHVDGAEFGLGLSTKQADFLANDHRIVVPGKWVGRTRHGSAEAGNAAALRQLKAINPDVLVYCFWPVNDRYASFYRSVADHRVPQGFTLRSRGGGDHISMPWHSEVLAWDTANPDMREWWVSTIADRVLGDGYDGVYVDGIKPYVLRSRDVAAALGEGVADRVAAGVDAVMDDLRAALAGSGKPVLYNGVKSSPLWQDGGMRYVDAGTADGAVLESFGCGSPPSREPASMIADMDLMASIDRRGAVAVFGAKPDTRPYLDEALVFSLACFLCCAGPNSYFRFPVPGLDRSAFAPYMRPLGPPRAPAERIEGSTRFSREFEHVIVDVDVASGAASIDWAADRR